MKNRKMARQIILWAVCASALLGCGQRQTAPGSKAPESAAYGQTAQATEATKTSEKEGKSSAESKPSLIEPGQSESKLPVTESGQSKSKPSAANPGLSDSSAEPSKPVIPQLPGTGSCLSDFIAEGWELMDSVELDYNGDGIADYVGVQEAAADWTQEAESDFPRLRLLFAVASDGPGQYRLDFQDENLIRTRWEGGVFGDPYEPLTASGASFTTHAFGGSAWKWSEAYTYTYREGTWYLTQAEEDYGYGPYTTTYTKSDWDSGICLHRERSHDFSDMEEHGGDYEGLEDAGPYDIEYEMRLDEPFTLYQAGKRWWLAPDRVTEWEIGEIILAEGIELAPEAVKTPQEGGLSHYCDEECLLYAFSNKGPDGAWDHYLAMYRWQDHSLSVLAKGDGPGSCLEEIAVYGDEIYYSTEVVAHVAYETERDGAAGIEEDDCVVGLRLNRIHKDGTGEETVFEYRYPGTDQTVLQEKPPYMGLIVNISGGEAVIEVYIGNGQPHPVYRMNVDGSGLRKIGQIPKR